MIFKELRRPSLLLTMELAPPLPPPPPPHSKPPCQAKLGTIGRSSIKSTMFLSTDVADTLLSINIRGGISDILLLCFVSGSTSRTTRIVEWGILWALYHHPININNNQGKMYSILQMISIYCKMRTGVNIVEWSLWNQGAEMCFVDWSLKNEQRSRHCRMIISKIRVWNVFVEWSL